MVWCILFIQQVTQLCIIGYVVKELAYPSLDYAWASAYAFIGLRLAMPLHYNYDDTIF